MNKCEQAQINIDRLISEFGKEYQLKLETNFTLDKE